jgi:hypothetical protein
MDDDVSGLTMESILFLAIVSAILVAIGLSGLIDTLMS